MAHAVTGLKWIAGDIPIGIAGGDLQ